MDEELIELHKKIGNNVKKRRTALGYSQLHLSQEIGQKSTTILSQAELSKNKHFNIEQLFKLSKALNCEICDFFE